MRRILSCLLVSFLFFCENPINKIDESVTNKNTKNPILENNLNGPVANVTFSECNENSDSCCLTEKITYNSSFIPTRESYYNCPDPNLIIVNEWYWYDYSYDSLGRLLNVIRMDDDTTKVYEWIYKYDTTDLPTFRYFVNHWIEVDSTIQNLFYDSLGRWTGYEEHLIQSWGVSETVNSSLVITYNGLGNSNTAEWKSGNITTRKRIQVYDKNELLIEFSEENDNETIIVHDYLEYTEFDSYGNWTSRICTDINENKSTEKRMIEYY